MGWVSAMAFSPDGTRLISTGVDGTLRVWEATLPLRPSIEGNRRKAFGRARRARASSQPIGSCCRQRWAW
jgi:WD40 repeat protein